MRVRVCVCVCVCARLHMHTSEFKCPIACQGVVERISLRRARRIIPVSQSLKQYLLDRSYAADRVHQVNNGVPISDAVTLPWNDGGPVVIGTVALFRPRKGIEVLLQALAELRQSGVDVRLRAVGPFETESYEAEIHALVRELGLTEHVHWTGFTSQVEREFSEMHVFVLPSLFGEGMPMVILEAMAAGVMVVSTNVEGIPEVVRDGIDGLLVEPNDAEQLAAALSRACADPGNVAAMALSGRDRQRQLFSDVSMARGSAEAYQAVLGTPQVAEAV